jgi:hypothetical protein
MSLPYGMEERRVDRSNLDQASSRTFSPKRLPFLNQPSIITEQVLKAHKI